MWDRSVNALWLALLWCGLCAAAPANTTAGARLPLAQNVLATPAAPVRAPTPGSAAPALPAPLIRMALLLPLRSPTLGTAAAAVRDGAQAAYQREPGGVALSVMESGQSRADWLSAYAAAVRESDIVIGPLSRAAVAVVAESGNVIRPTIALAQPSTHGASGADEPALPSHMLAVGLSLEDEARQVADWIGSAEPGGEVFVISTGIAWQQRTARAFASQAQIAGLRTQSMELSQPGAALSAGGLAQLRTRITAEQPQALFIALEVGQARQLRAAIGNQVALYGTSQLNPLAPADWVTAEPVNELDGARLVDIPWQLQPDHPAVMVYPHPVVAAGQPRSADLERLYALGIDAYRVAREIATGHGSFEIDGVTGRLAVSFGDGAPGFRRIEPRAVYRDGRVQPLAGAPAEVR